VRPARRPPEVLERKEERRRVTQRIGWVSLVKTTEQRREKERGRSMGTIAKISRRGKIVLLAVALTLAGGSAVLPAPGMGATSDGGENSTRLTASSAYRNASVVGPGLDLGDGTFEVSVSCDAGDRLLSGWPAGIDSTSTLLRSSAEDPNTWNVRVNKNGWTDDFSAEVICADQQ